MTDIEKMLSEACEGTGIEIVTLNTDARWLMHDLTFDSIIDLLYADEVKRDSDLAERLYSSLTNTLWTNGETYASMSFRYAAGFIADMRDIGETYMDFYCCAPEGVVDEAIAIDLRQEGWWVAE